MKKRTRKSKDIEVNTAQDRPKIVAEVMPQKEEKRGIKLFSNKPFVASLIVIILIILVASGIYVFSYFAEDAKISAETSTQELERITKELSKIAILPDEVPQIATVTDVEELSGQPFFDNAENGDKVVIYGQARMAVLYRPTIKKIINMSTVNQNGLAADGQQATDSATTNTDVSPSPQAKIKVAVMNSTQEAGLARKGGDLLDDDTFEVIGSLNANGNYDSTFISVINRSVVNESAINQITQSIGDVKVGTQSLPSDEAAPAGADAVLILGSDFSEAY